jgi:protein phosphatase PTC7
MQNAFSEVATSELGKPVCPYEVLDRAYQRTAASGTPAASTAVIVSLAGRALKWAYVGDSGFAVFRDGKMLHRFQPQQRYFNCPFQLRSANGVSTVRDAAVGEIAVEEGYVLVVASDGLFDNVFDSTLENLVQVGTVLGCTPEEMAGLMAFQAYMTSMNPTKDSPFSIASREHGQARTGGKQDDITVVVAFIESQDSGFFGY